MFKDNVKPLSRKSDIVTQEIGTEILIYDLITNKAYNLNEMSAIIWENCDGNNSVSTIARNLSGKFNAPITEDFIWLALEQLKKDNLLENADEVSPDFGGLSRREVIRKVGFASLVALPIISSIIAPIGIHAASVTCTGNCRCPNATGTPTGAVNCNGPSGPGTFINCDTLAGSTCNCVGPYGVSDSAGLGFKTAFGCR